MEGYRKTYKITGAAAAIYRAMVQGTLAGEAAYGGAANAANFVGITQDAAAQDTNVSVQENGRSYAVAYGAVAVGEYVGIGDTAGRLASNDTAAKAAPTTPGLVYVVGVARTAAGQTDDIFEVQIAPFLVKTATS